MKNAEKLFGEGHVRISAKTYSGVEELKERILEALRPLRATETETSRRREVRPSSSSAGDATPPTPCHRCT
jgi:50S ribosomal subunit-associated GTPase HflX